MKDAKKNIEQEIEYLKSIKLTPTGEGSLSAFCKCLQWINETEQPIPSANDLRQKIANILYKGESVLDKIMELLPTALYSLLSDKIRKKDEEIERLKAENLVSIKVMQLINKMYPKQMKELVKGLEAIKREQSINTIQNGE